MASRCKHCKAGLQAPAEPVLTAPPPSPPPAAPANAPAPAPANAPLPPAQALEPTVYVRAPRIAQERRWLISAAAVLVFAIGIAVGVLIERAAPVPCPQPVSFTADRPGDRPAEPPPESDPFSQSLRW